MVSRFLAERVQALRVFRQNKRTVRLKGFSTLLYYAGFTYRVATELVGVEKLGTVPLFIGLTLLCAYDEGQTEIEDASYQPSRGQMESKMTLSP